MKTFDEAVTEVMAKASLRRDMPVHFPFSEEILTHPQLPTAILDLLADRIHEAQKDLPPAPVMLHILSVALVCFEMGMMTGILMEKAE